jgi:predicted RNase H-like HicB family nuclease
MAKVSYAVIIEQGDGNLSAYAPDLPGCVAVGDTIEETMREMTEAIEFHLEGLQADGLPIPKPSIIAHQDVSVDLPAA